MHDSFGYAFKPVGALKIKDKQTSIQVGYLR